jgi:hypothetical protein
MMLAQLILVNLDVDVSLNGMLIVMIMMPAHMIIVILQTDVNTIKLTVMIMMLVLMTPVTHRSDAPILRKFVMIMMLARMTIVTH